MAIGVLLAAVSLARAQVQPVTGYYVVVTGDETPLRSGEGELLYPVAKLSKGTLLRVDGTGKGFLRVAYPTGTACFVPADSVQVDAAAKSASVTKPTRLKAFNMTTGFKGSWKDVLDQPLTAGTKLTLAEADPVNDGRGNAAYKVVPHETARAFVQESAVAKATQEQIDQYMAKLTPKAGEKPVEHAAKQEKPKAESKPEKPTATATTEDSKQPEGTNLTQPKVKSEVKSDQGEQAIKTDDQPLKAKPIEPPKNPWERLETAFENVRRQPAESAEYTALMGEYQAAIDALPDVPQNATVKRGLNQRLEYLKLQLDIQAKQRELAETKQNLNVDEQKLAERIKDVERTRQYTIVGRLSASSIYDGKRLPLMFRVLAVGGSSSRTLAYVKPDEKLKVESKIGQIVGVLGESRLDPTLKSNVITPLRIDTLEAAPSTTPPATTEPTPAQAPSAEAPGGGPGGH
jgi:hypothetical protein